MSDLEKICERYETARRRYEAIGMVNTYGKTQEEMVELHAEAARAASELNAAKAAYDEASK